MTSCGPKRTDTTGTYISYEAARRLPWRTGTQVGRTVYACDPATGWERLILVCDTITLAEHVVRVHNEALAAWEQAERNQPF